MTARAKNIGGPPDPHGKRRRGAGRGSNPTSAEQVRIAQRRAKAIELRAQNLSLREIARRLEVAISTVHGDLEKATADLVPMEAVETVRARELDRFDTIQNRLWPVLADPTYKKTVVTKDGEVVAVEPSIEDKRAVAELLLKVADRRYKWAGVEKADLRPDPESLNDVQLEAQILGMIERLATPAPKELAP